MMKNKKPKILDTRRIFESRKFYIYEMDMEFADGHREVWEYVQPKWKAGVQILALTDEQELVLIREYRGAADRFVTRIPTGAVEDHEEAVDAARRELEEECGFYARDLELLEEQPSSSSYYKSTLYVFLARRLVKTKPHRDSGEEMEVVLVQMDKALKMVEDLSIQNPQTIYSILWLHKYLKARE